MNALVRVVELKSHESFGVCVCEFLKKKKSVLFDKSQQQNKHVNMSVHKSVWKILRK